MKVKFLKESTVLGSDSKKLRETLLKHTSQSIANFAANSFDQSNTLSDGSPSIFAFNKVEGYPVIIEAYSFQKSIKAYSFQKSNNSNDPDYELFKCNPKSDCYVAVYVIKDGNLVRLTETDTLSNSFSPSRAKTIVLTLSKYTTLKSLLDRSLSFGLKKAFEFNKNFPDLA